MKISWSWSTRREGNDGFVLEQRSDGLATEYGPMPAHIVPAFVEGRRRIIATIAHNANADYIEEDFSWLKDPNPKAH